MPAALVAALEPPRFEFGEGAKMGLKTGWVVMCTRSPSLPPGPCKVVTVALGGAVSDYCKSQAYVVLVISLHTSHVVPILDPILKLDY